MKLQYSFFDFDDNILHLETKINMDFYDGVEWTPVKLSTTAYALNRNNPQYRIPQIDGKPDYDKAYGNFRDLEGRKNSYMDDCIYALRNEHYAPSYNAFKDCIINGYHLYIVTARGHEPETIKSFVKYFIFKHMSAQERDLMKNNLIKIYNIYEIPVPENIIDVYLDSCQFIGVSSKSFIESIKPFELNEPYDISKAEIGKEIVVKRFIEKCIKNRNKAGDKVDSISIGFSDDDTKNIVKITETFKEAKKVYPDVKFVIYDTSRNQDGSTNYIKTIIE